MLEEEKRHINKKLKERIASEQRITRVLARYIDKYETVETRKPKQPIDPPIYTFTNREKRYLEGISKTKNLDQKFVKKMIEFMYKNDPQRLKHRSAVRTTNGKRCMSPHKCLAIERAMQLRVPAEEKEIRGKIAYRNRLIGNALGKLTERVLKQGRISIFILHWQCSFLSQIGIGVPAVKIMHLKVNFDFYRETGTGAEFE